MNFWNEFLRKWDFWEYCYVLKIKEINLKAIKCMNQNTNQNKREQNHKVEFFWQPRKLKVRIEANLHEFLKASEKKNQIKWRISKAIGKAF